MGRRNSRFEKEGMKKGVWTAREDKILVDYVKQHGEGKWGKVSRETGLRRCGKSVRLRWLNYLRPDIKRGNIAEDEEELIIRLHKLLGNRWSLIAGRIPGRTDNEIKNYWNSTLRRKLQHVNHSEVSRNETKENSSSHGGDDLHLTSTNEGGMIIPTTSSCSFINNNNNNSSHGNKEEDDQLCHHINVSTITTDAPPYYNATFDSSGADLGAEMENKNDDMAITGDDLTWSEFIMDLNEGHLDLSISEFLHTDFSKLCEPSSESPMNIDQLPINWAPGSRTENGLPEATQNYL